MKNILFLLFISISQVLLSQTPAWYSIPNAPDNNIKLDDIFFINPVTGWLASGQGQPNIFKTTNGGLNWSSLPHSSLNYRSIGFADSVRGWAGVLDTNIIFRTLNGGTSWSPVVLPSSGSWGTCGLFVYNKDTVYGCGQVGGPGFFYKTTNGGINWTSQNMGSYCSMLMDCYFTSRDSGFVVGGIGLPYYDSTRCVILFTSDGGASWTNRYQGILKKQWCWKIHFTNSNTAYTSVESWRFTDTVSYLKTTNRGLTWTEYSFQIDTTNFHAQGILFLDNGSGWIGGYRCCAPSVINGKTYQTTNNGITWQPVLWGYNVNRIRYVNDTVLYASGRTVYKYTSIPIGIITISTEIPELFQLYQNYPNPFNPHTVIRYALTVNSNVSLKVFDILGKEVTILVNEKLNAGTYESEWDASNEPSGVYYYRLTAGDYSETKRMVLLK